MSDHPKPAEIEDVLSSIRRLVAGGAHGAPAQPAQTGGAPSGPEDGADGAEAAADRNEATAGDGEAGADLADPDRDDMVDDGDAWAGAPEGEADGAAPLGDAAGGAGQEGRRPGAPLSALVLTPALRVAPGREAGSEGAEDGADFRGDDAAGDGESRDGEADAASDGSPRESSRTPGWPPDQAGQAPRQGFGFGIGPSDDAVPDVPSEDAGKAGGSEEGPEAGREEAGSEPVGADADGERERNDASEDGWQGDAPSTSDLTGDAAHASEAAFGGGSPGFMNDDALFDAETQGQDDAASEGDDTVPPREGPRGPIISPSFARPVAARPPEGGESQDGPGPSDCADMPDEVAPADDDPGAAAPLHAGSDGPPADADAWSENDDDGPLAPEAPSPAPERAAPEPEASGDEPFNLFDEEGGGIDEEALRALVVDVVHRELQGALGERVSRNIRALVRREVAKALEARDLD